MSYIIDKDHPAVDRVYSLFTSNLMRPFQVEAIIISLQNAVLFEACIYADFEAVTVNSERKRLVNEVCGEYADSIRAYVKRIVEKSKGDLTSESKIALIQMFAARDPEWLEEHVKAK